MLRKIRWAILILAIIVLMTAMVQNSDPVQLRFFGYQTALPASILLLVVLVIGFLAGLITAIWLLRRRETAKRKAESAAESVVPPAVIESAPTEPAASSASSPPGANRSGPLGLKHQG